MKKLLIIALLFTISINGISQNSKQAYFQGFTEEVSGKRFGYHSPIPEVSSCLIIRGREDYKSIEWMTEAVPEDYKEKYVSYIWLFGMDVTLSPADFLLSVNGKPCVSFSSSTVSELGIKEFHGKNGAKLSFNVTMLDIHKDQMGFAILKLPADSVLPGEPSTIKISSSSVENDAWFMTYATAIEEKVDIFQNSVVAKKDGKLFHTVSIDIVHVGEDASAKIAVGDIKKKGLLKAGFNRMEIYLPKAESETGYTAEIKIQGKKPIQLSFSLSPVKEWEIYLVQHTHTDIGYTRPQTEILPEHLKYIDHALDFCDQTDGYPYDAQFRWTCETSWSVREYLRSRPQAQVDRLLKRIQEGRIEATGMFLNYSEIIDESALAAQTKTLKMLKNRGVDVVTAMQNDVNGIAWCLVDYYANTDVKYLTMGVHAHRARKPFNQPTAFWWQSPAGNRLLAYRSEHYQYGNTIGITSGQQDVLRNNLSFYLSGLEEKGYPYNKVSLQFSGYVTDNSPPSVAVCDIIKEWNEKYEWPKLKSALAKDFMIFLDEEHADEIPSKEVAWPDWWTDGVGSAANVTKEVRKTHVKIGATTSLLSMGKLLGNEMPENFQEEIELVYDNLLFYDEHTHGAAESVRDPLVQNSVNQWSMKSAYAWDAAKRSSALEEKALAFIEPVLNKSNLTTIAVFNSLNWKRSGVVNLFIHNTMLPEDGVFNITDSDGREVPYQQFEQRSEGAYYGLWVEDIPPVGYKTLQVNAGMGSMTAATHDSNFENNFYAISIDTDRGVITSIYDKELQQELIDLKDTLTLGQFIYEELDNRHEMERLTSTTRDTVYKPLGLDRTLLSDIRIIKKENGAIYNSIFLNGSMPVCADERGVSIEIRLYHYKKKIDLLYKMIKLPVTSPEGVYVSFPFEMKDGKLAFEVQGGVVYPGKNQLEGSSSDWNTIQNFAAVKGEKSQIVFVSNEIPLVQFGDINTGRYYYRLNPKTNHIYSWVLNNYWVTNFKASQEGELQWTYSITSSSDQSDMFATKFGWGERVPLLSRIMLPTKGVESSELVSRSLININLPNLLLVNSTPSLDEKGIILHLREVEGDHAILDIRRLMEETGASSIHEVNVLEEEMSELHTPLLIEHYETKFIQLNFD